MTKKGSRLLSFGRRKHRDRPSAAAAAAAAAAVASSSKDISIMEEKLRKAEAIIVKWDPESSTYAKITSLFSEARHFLTEVYDLQRAMLAFVKAADSSRLSHPCIVRAQTLMQTAMRRLDKEFYQILATNRDLLEPESVSVRSALSSVSKDPGYDPWECSPEHDTICAGQSMADLHAIADTMVFAGYGKECVRTYKTLHKSIVKVQSWLGASRFAVMTLFHGEGVLLDHVFAGSDI